MYRRQLIIAGVVIGLVVIGFIIYALIPRATLVMSVAPEEFIVSINGHDKKVKTGDSITVTPGEVSFELSRDGFDTYAQKITIKNGQKIEILQALKPQNNIAKALLETKKSQEIIQRIAGMNMNKIIDKLSKSYPILDVLPINDKYFTITSCSSQKYPNDATKVAICVNLYNLDAKQSAINAVKKHGFDLDEYEVYFVDKSYNPDQQAGH